MRPKNLFLILALLGFACAALVTGCPPVDDDDSADDDSANAALMVDDANRIV